MSYWQDTDLAYLAGLLDGEGYFSPKDSGLLVVNMASTAATSWAQRTFGGRLNARTPRAEHHKVLQEWALEKQNVLCHLLPAVEPFLKHKTLECRALYALVQHAAKNKPGVRNHPDNPEHAAAWADWHAERARLQRAIQESRV